MISSLQPKRPVGSGRSNGTSQTLHGSPMQQEQRREATTTAVPLNGVMSEKRQDESDLEAGEKTQNGHESAGEPAVQGKK